MVNYLLKHADYIELLVGFPLGSPACLNFLFWSFCTYVLSVLCMPVNFSICQHFLVFYVSGFFLFSVLLVAIMWFVYSLL